MVHKIGTNGDCAVTVYEMSADSIALAKQAAAEAKPQLLQRPPIKVMGRDVDMPRNVGFFSLQSQETQMPLVKEYRFSRQSVPSIPASASIEKLIHATNQEFGINCNAVLVNEYPAGDTSSIGAHGDDEKGLDTSRGVFGINVYDDVPDGKLRKMVFKEKATKERLEVILAPNTIFSMTGVGFQKTITHEIPRAKDAARRMSFTFREHVEGAPKRVAGKRRAKREREPEAWTADKDRVQRVAAGFLLTTRTTASRGTRMACPIGVSPRGVSGKRWVCWRASANIS